MFIWEICLFIWYFPQFCTSDMSKYGYLSVSEGPFDFEITKVGCMSKLCSLLYHGTLRTVSETCRFDCILWYM